MIQSAQMLIVLFFVCLGVGCAPRSSLTVLIKMIADQESFFKHETVASFAAKNHTKVTVLTYTDPDSLELFLDSHAHQVGLIKVPFSKASALVAHGNILPLAKVITPAELDQIGKKYLLTSLGTYNDTLYYIPRKFETRIMVYSKKAALDARSRFKFFKDSIGTSLKGINGYGLPATYQLEDNPALWDYYDLYTVGYIWAHTPYSGLLSPKIANRGKRYSGTSLGVIDRVFQCGGDSTAVLSMQGDAVVDAFYWDAVFAAQGIYNPRMWTEGWSGTDIWKAFKTGDVFLSFMTQLDCFFLHGTGRDGLMGYFPDAEDMGVAIMPRACSVILDNNGTNTFEGRRSITTGGWWWGISATAPDPKHAYAMAMHITSAQNQIEESGRFGMIPVRKEILSDMAMMFGGGWIKDVYDVSFRQLMENKDVVIPMNEHFDAIGALYLDAWFEIVAGKNWSHTGGLPSRETIANRLSDDYVPRAAKILGKGKISHAQ